MDAFSRFFIVGVLILDLLAIVYFGGHFLLTGHILPHNENVTQQKLAKLVKIEKQTDTTKLAKQEPKKKALMPASADRGERVAGLCLSCHSFKKGGQVMTGPPLWGIVGKEIASHSGFQYSQIFLEMKEDGLVWNKDTLNEFLESPRRYASGTKMSFAGLRKEQQRVDLIAYLKTLGN